MKRLLAAVKRGFGALTMAIGAMILVWIAYNMLIERQPETDGLSVLGALGFSVAATSVGYQWLRGRSLATANPHRTPKQAAAGRPGEDGPRG